MTPALRLIYLSLGTHTIIMAQPDGDKSYCMVNLLDESNRKLVEQILGTFYAWTNSMH